MAPHRVGDVCNLITSGSRGWGEYYAESGPGFIRAQNIRFGKLRLDGLACVNPPAKSEGARTQVAKGDLLIVITGAGVTNPALLDVDLGEAYVSQHVGLVRPCDTGLSPWLLLCLMADAGGRAELTMRAYGAGKPGLNLGNIRSLSVPLPPLAEQHRIVAKVDALMTLCDKLEASITTGEHIRSRLLEAVLHNALEPA
ncbi:restriction endonuclease subunit S [Sphingomonas sp. I4]